MSLRVGMVALAGAAFVLGAPMAHAKTTRAGRDERVRVLGATFGRATIARAIRHTPRGANVDDVLDAFAGAWTARRQCWRAWRRMRV